MEILLAGGSGLLMDGLIDKFRKEGHRVYILTGTRYRHSPYKKAFEKYYFPYDSDSLSEIFQSVNPDVIIFLGAYDTNFVWNKKCEQEAVRFQAGLANMLIAFSGMDRARFIYLSSQEVYTGDYEEEITEEMPVSPGGTKAMAISQGEQLCLSYSRNLGRDVIVLRADHIYYNAPKIRDEVRDVCSRMCLEAVQKGEIILGDNVQFSMLHQNDAVEFIYRIACAAHHRNDLYNLASRDIFSHETLADMIKEKMGEESSVSVSRPVTDERRILSGRLYDSEFGMNVFHSPKETIEETLRLMKRHPENYTAEGNRETGWIRRITGKMFHTIRALIPFIENMICFIPFFMLNNRAVGSDYFQNLDFYLLYVLLFAIIYGQNQAVFSGVLAVAGYCFRQMYDRSGFDVMLDYNTYVWIAQLFIVGLVVGYMKDQLRVIKGEDEQERDYLLGLLGDMEDINSSNMRMKNVLETQIVNQNDSMGKLYEITVGLDQYSPQEVLFYATEVLQKVIGSQDVSIYLVANDTYARLFTATSRKAKELGNSIEYRELKPLYEALKERKVYINREMDERYPLMANAIYSEESMQIIVMAWGIPWERMTLGQANMLSVVSHLIQNAVMRANRYLEALEQKRYVENTNILDEEAFVPFVKAYTDARAKGLTSCSFLEVQYSDMMIEDAAEILSGNLRQTDLIGSLGGGSLYVILANSSMETAEHVSTRFISSGLLCKARWELEV